jgi:hypothetical protein
MKGLLSTSDASVKAALLCLLCFAPHCVATAATNSTTGTCTVKVRLYDLPCRGEVL